MAQHRVINADCVEAMREMPEASVDSVVCDPPYGLAFMNKHWDTVGQSWHEMWASEALRVLKPGGYLLAFGGTRTYHRLACAIEDAGFEIRDTIEWIYASGFPKSHAIGKAIDKMAGAEREVVGKKVFVDGRNNRGLDTNIRGGRYNDKHSVAHSDNLETAPATPQAQQWEGWGTALKPAHEPVVMARKPLAEKSVAANVLEHGTGAINVDACRVGLNGDKQTPAQGRWPANLILSHAPGCERVGVRRVRGSNGVRGRGGDKYRDGKGFANMHSETGQEVGYADPDGTEEVEAWECIEGCPVAELDRQSGNRPGATSNSNGSVPTFINGGNGGKRSETLPGYADKGGASRFFYVAKASRRERNAGLTEGETSSHPTVKPIALMRYLVRMVTPPGGTVLDAFCGSGSTGCAAVLEGFSFIGIEREEEYVTIAEKRIAHYQDEIADRLFA